jgi:PKD repeat protein
MNNNYVLKAFFTSAPPPSLSVSITPMSASIILGQSVQFTSLVTGGTQPYKYQWYLDGVPVSGANGTSWTFTPTATGVYYVYLNVTDANNNTVTSGTAKIVVSSIPVGGYAISLAKETSASTFQTIFYTALLILFGAILSLTKRKRK